MGTSHSSTTQAPDQPCPRRTSTPPASTCLAGTGRILPASIPFFTSLTAEAEARGTGLVKVERTISWITSSPLETTIVVTPTFYGFNFTIPGTASNETGELGFDTVGLNRFYDLVRRSYLDYLVPYVEANWQAETTSDRRAFGGLSLGGGLTLNMLFNATEDFSHFAVMSNIPSPLPTDPIWNKTPLREVGIMSAGGFYDIAFENVRNFQTVSDVSP